MAQIYLPGMGLGGRGGLGGVGLTVIIMQVSVQIGLNWKWPTGTELGQTC